MDNFMQLHVSLLTLRKALSSTFWNFMYTVMSRKFAILCCDGKVTDDRAT